MWVFGYGAMMWKADFPFVQRVPGCVTGYVRRFWLASEDYLGIPSKPGRVVTIFPTRSPNDMVWGVTYLIDKENEESVASKWELYERAGYVSETATFYPVLTSRVQLPCTVRPFDVTLYVPTEDNSYFMKDEPLEETASCIANAYGPSGSNAEYLYNLAAEVRLIAPNYKDTHLYSLESAVQELQASNETPEDICDEEIKS